MCVLHLREIVMKENTMNSEVMYYYTDYNTFKLILANGTLRFKESTSSNDKLDTVQLYDYLLKMAEEKLKETNLTPEQEFYFDMLKHNGAKSNRISLVACFTSKADSRLLWDAYTMHRKDRSAERYNGVCIEINKTQLWNAMKKSGSFFDVKKCDKIVYGFEKINPLLERMLKTFSSEVETLSKDEDQTQNIIAPIPIPFTKKELVLKKSIVFPMLHLVENFDTVAPYFKHSFWREECETRALLSVKKGSANVERIPAYGDGSRYFDLPISLDCISKVILGPELSKFELDELNTIGGKIPFSNLLTVPSNGTNIITNR